MKGQDRRADQIPAEPVEWLIDGFVPRGHISLIVGVAGHGKSTLAARWAADITTGVASGKRERVMISATEDHVGAVVIPRLKAAGADMKRAWPERSWRFPRDLDELASIIAKRRISALILDPLDDHVDNIGGQEGRQTLGELAELAETYNTAIIAVHHFTKSGKTIDLAIGGGRGVQGVSRSTMIFGPEPRDQLSPTASQEEREEHEENANRLIVAHYKCNLGPLRESLVYEREAVPHPTDTRQTVPVLNYIEESPHSAEEVFGVGVGERRANGGTGTRATAKNLILHLLSQGSKTPAELESAVLSGGVSERVYKRARTELSSEDQIEYQEFPDNQWQIKVPNAPPTAWAS